MRAATQPRVGQRLVIADANGDRVILHHRRPDDLVDWLGPGDLLVVNDAATLPASIRGSVDGAPVEWRLVAQPRPDLWWALVFDSRDWRTDTDLRTTVPGLRTGQRVSVGTARCEIAGRSPWSNRLVLLRVPEHFSAVLFATGTPVQYAYTARDLGLSEVQTPFSSVPWAVEAPSSGFCFSWRLLAALRARGVALATVTHAAGLSATGEPALDAHLPFPERYRVPEATIRAVGQADRVIAVGTSASRALESAARGPSEGITRLVLGRDTERLATDGLLSNLHGPGESHFELMRAFLSGEALEALWHQSEQRGYLAHEFGDCCLLLSPGRGAASAAQCA